MESPRSISVLVPDGIISHVGISLVEGLIDLGYTIYTNGFQLAGAITPNLSRPSDSSFLSSVIVTSALTEGPLIIDHSRGLGPYTESVKSLLGKRRIVFLDMDDSVNFRDFPSDALAFCTHQINNATRYGNIRPMGFSLSRTLIERAEHQAVSRTGKPSFIHNFRPTFQQGIRNHLELSLVPKLNSNFSIYSGLTSSDEYAARLSTAHAVLAYGGELFKSFKTNPGLPVPPQLQNFRFIVDYPVVTRWDSWRFWESCIFGCAPITLDFDHYGLVLPTPPTPYVHYVPVRFGDEQRLVDQLRDMLADDPSSLLTIGAKARAWALSHYAPRAVADYVMREVDSFFEMPGA